MKELSRPYTSKGPRQCPLSPVPPAPSSPGPTATPHCPCVPGHADPRGNAREGEKFTRLYGAPTPCRAPARGWCSQATQNPARVLSEKRWDDGYKLTECLLLRPRWVPGTCHPIRPLQALHWGRRKERLAEAKSPRAQATHTWLRQNLDSASQP